MPQRPLVRKKQKKRRSRKLAEWRQKQEQANAAVQAPPAKSTDKA